MQNLVVDEENLAFRPRMVPLRLKSNPRHL